MPTLFRGFSQVLTAPDQVNIFYHTPRTPQDTDPMIHDIADQWFLDRFGVRARSSALICTTDFSQANMYGKATYRIIPDAPAKIIYSSSVKDFFEHHHELAEHTKNHVVKWLEEMNFQMVDHSDEIESTFFGEVMVICETYTAIPRV